MFFKRTYLGQILLVSFFSLLGIETHGQICYYDASAFPIIGTAVCTNNEYKRLPDSLQCISRPILWELGRNSAGLSIRFKSNSSRIILKWEVLCDNHMSHMTDIGVKGLDLYCWEGSIKKWRFVNSARPFGKQNQVTVISDMVPKEREFMLYLPLYDGISSMTIGIDSVAMIEKPALSYPNQYEPIVFYGTSIMQGCSASRPGMAYTNIISRRLNKECINFGFSGNAFLDLEIAHLMASVKASVYVLDFVPNASVSLMKERLENFYRIIRTKHSTVPIVFVEDPVFPQTHYSQAMALEVARKNQVLNQQFVSLQKQGEKNIYLVKSEDMLGDDGEATVDGIHFTDLGMIRYADLLTSVISKLID